MQTFNDERDWFFKKRFGLFVHWGLYSINGFHEQEQQRYGVPAEEYVKLINKFNPVNFDPEKWLDLAEKAGMEYLVLTTKHHDGFCLWDTKQTDFNIMNSPYKQDIVGKLVEACHRRSFPVELYYSVVDWHHPCYPNIGRHHEIETDPAKHDLEKYMEFLKEQVRELCTNYGKIHGIWWDMNVPKHKDPSIHEMIRKLQPAAVINNRGFDTGDYSTPEREVNPEGADSGDDSNFSATEACQSVGVNSWGYRKDEDYFSARHLAKSIDMNLAKGYNYLLNVGPNATGEIPSQSICLLEKIGEWYHKVKESFYTPANRLCDDSNILTTENNEAIYIHCPEGLDSNTLPLHHIKEKPREIVLLNTGEKIEFTFEPIIYQKSFGDHLRLIKIPVEKLYGTVPVFKIIKL